MFKILVHENSIPIIRCMYYMYLNNYLDHNEVSHIRINIIFCTY